MAYAFWRYDLFPYFLGGKITKTTLEGFVETKEYGKSQLFKPFIIIDDNKEGKRVKDSIDIMKNKYELYKGQARIDARRDGLHYVGAQTFMKVMCALNNEKNDK